MSLLEILCIKKVDSWKSNVRRARNKQQDLVILSTFTFFGPTIFENASFFTKERELLLKVLQNRARAQKLISIGNSIISSAIADKHAHF